MTPRPKIKFKENHSLKLLTLSSTVALIDGLIIHITQQKLYQTISDQNYKMKTKSDQIYKMKTPLEVLSFVWSRYTSFYIVSYLASMST